MTLHVTIRPPEEGDTSHAFVVSTTVDETDRLREAISRHANSGLSQARFETAELKGGRYITIIVVDITLTTLPGGYGAQLYRILREIATATNVSIRNVTFDLHARMTSIYLSEFGERMQRQEDAEAS